MSIQKFHREAYDIVLSNFPGGAGARACDQTFRAGGDRVQRARAVQERRGADVAADVPRADAGRGADRERPGRRPRGGHVPDRGAGRARAAARTAAGVSPGWRSRPRRTRTARITTWRSCAPAPPTTNARPRAPENDPQAGRKAGRGAGRQLSLEAAVRAAHRPPAEAAPAPAPPAAAATAAGQHQRPSRRPRPRRAAHLPRGRAAARDAADAREPLRRRARRGRDLRAQALRPRAPLLLASRTRRRRSTACCSRARRRG